MSARPSLVMRMLAGLEQPSGGTVQFGTDIVSDGERGWTIDATRLGLLLRRPEGISVAIVDTAAMKVVQEARIEL